MRSNVIYVWGTVRPTASPHSPHPQKTFCQNNGYSNPAYLKTEIPFVNRYDHGIVM